MKKTLFALIAAFLAAQSYATPLVGTGIPNLAGSTVIDFEGIANSSFNSETIANVTFSGIGGPLRISGPIYAGDYNTTGTRYLDNNAGNTDGIRFDFTTPVSAFTFNFGASDAIWTLSAYSASNVLIESLSIAATHSSNSGAYFGLANVGMSYATLTSSFQGDYILLDNFRTLANTTDVPEPASLALFGIAAAGALAARRRKKLG